MQLLINILKIQKVMQKQIKNEAFDFIVDASNEIQRL